MVIKTWRDAMEAEVSDGLIVSTTLVQQYMQAEVDELRQENARLRDANDLLDNALIAAFPMGAKGLVFELWNAARAALGES